MPSPTTIIPIVPVSSWSFSKLGDFEKCKRLFELKHVKKIPEPDRPLKPGQLEHANDRGTRVHEQCEQYINGTIPDMGFEAEKHFGAHMDLLRCMYKDGLVSLEGEWGMSRTWEVCGWNGDWMPVPDATAQMKKAAKAVPRLPERGKIDQDILVGKTLYTWIPSWLRLKLDAMVMHSDTEATVIDFKTGRKFGNEVKHAEQLLLYQLVAFLRYPKLQTVHAELWYLDQNEVTAKTYTRMQGLRFKQNFDLKGNKVTTTTEFPPNPNKFSCMWCPYKPSGSGHCDVGV